MELIGLWIYRSRLRRPHRPAVWVLLRNAVGPWPSPGRCFVTSSTPRPESLSFLSKNFFFFPDGRSLPGRGVQNPPRTPFGARAPKSQCRRRSLPCSAEVHHFTRGCRRRRSSNSRILLISSRRPAELRLTPRPRKAVSHPWGRGRGARGEGENPSWTPGLGWGAGGGGRRVGGPQ